MILVVLAIFVHTFHMKRRNNSKTRLSIIGDVVMTTLYLFYPDVKFFCGAWTAHSPVGKSYGQPACIDSLHEILVFPKIDHTYHYITFFEFDATERCFRVKPSLYDTGR
jgi:hypothetical protein